MPRITALNSSGVSWPVTRPARGKPSGDAMRSAGHPSSRNAWLWVAIMPYPSHGRRSARPALPSQARPRMSITNTSGRSSSTGRAVVIMKEVIPEPDPKCFSP
jgi:hypothetical protein